MLEPPKMFSDARHTSDVLEIESLAKLVYELDIQMDSNLFQTFETLVELAGTKQFLQTFSRFQYYLLNLKFLQTGCYGLGHSVPFQNNSNLYPMMYPNQTPPSPTSPLPFTDVSGSSTSTSSTSNTTSSSSSSSSSSIPTTNTTNASIPTAPLPGSAVGGMAGNPSTPPYGALGQSAIPPQNANFNMTAPNANPANPSVATTSAAGTTTNAATPFSPNDFYGFVGNGAAPDANTAALLNTPPNYFPNQAGMMTAAYPTQYDPTLMGMATPYGSMDAQGPMTGAANPLLATPMSTETSSSAATDMDIDYPLATIVESEAEKSEENLSSQSTLASIPTTSTISATNATATTATVITTATTAAIATTTTPITTNAVADSTIASTTITPTTINTTTSIAATTSSSTTTTTTTTTIVNSTTSDKIDNTVKDITKEKELNEVKIDTEASSQEEIKKDMNKVEDISKDIAITSTITPITTTAVNTTATTTTSTTTNVTPTINISNDIKKEGENISLAVDTKTTTTTAATEVATATSTTASSEKKINSEIKIETLENKDEISTGNNANANANANTNTTVETTATPAEVNTAATVGNMANVANMANVPTVDPSIMATAAMEGQQPAAPPPPMVLTEMDKALYPTAAEGLAGQFPLPLGAPVFPYDDPSMLKRPDMNMNEMAFHLSNGGSASPMANYPGYGFNPVDKMGHPGAPNPTHLNGQAYPPSTMYNRYGPGPDGRVAPNAPATHYYNKVNPHYEHMNYGGAYPGYNPMGHQHPYVHRVYNNQTPLHKISLQQQYHMVKKNSSSSSKASKMNEMTKIKTYGNKKHSAENKKSGVYQNLYI